MSSEPRWSAHPGAARAVTLFAFAVPVLLGVAAGWAATDWLRPRVAAGLVVLGVLAVTLLVVEVIRRVTTRLLPLAALLQLDLPFPGQPPSRFGVALRAGSTRRLQQLVRDDPSTDAADAAVTILAYATALSRHDRATRGHSERVRAFADLLGEALGLDRPDRDRLRWAALLHDVGKLGVHADVLNKDTALDDAEWEAIRRHPLEGARLAAPLRPFLGAWVTSIEHHHERWDGSGYPHGLVEEDIALGARIVAVADTYEVMTSPARTYRRPVTPLAAQQELARVAGTQLDPAMVRAFLTINERELRKALGVMALVLQLPNLLRLRAPLPSGTVTPGDPTAVPDGQFTHARHPDAQLDPRASSSGPQDLDGDAGGDDLGAGLDR